MTDHDCGFELGCDDDGCPNRPENRTSNVVKAVAEALGWSWSRIGDAQSPEACVESVLRDLHALGYEVVPLGHPDCVQAVRHVAETHHGPDYPHCTCGSDNYEHSYSCDPLPRQCWDYVNDGPTMVMTYRLFEDDHGLRCPRCQREVRRNQPYESVLTGMTDDGETFNELVCVYCVAPAGKAGSRKVSETP